MTRLLLVASLGFVLLAASPASAAEKTVTLAVQNMDCASCPYTVKRSLTAVPGVANVVVSLREKTAIVTYDDTKTDIPRLTAATTNAGYPATVKN